MFIEHTAYTNILSPRGATCDSATREEYLTQRRNGAEDAGKSEIESVGVGLPNPSGEETSPLRWICALNFGALLPLAPEGRHVYSRAAYTK